MFDLPSLCLSLTKRTQCAMLFVTPMYAIPFNISNCHFVWVSSSLGASGRQSRVLIDPFKTRPRRVADRGPNLKLRCSECEKKLRIRNLKKVFRIHKPKPYSADTVPDLSLILKLTLT